MTQPWAAERALAETLARAAGEVTLRHRSAGFRVDEKPGGEGPVTAADREADALIRAGLARAFPDDGLLTEETPDDGAWRARRRVWMVDPLDGTQEYVKGADDYACMIGLCQDGVPVVGAVYRPVGDVLYLASRGGGAIRVCQGRTEVLHCATTVPDPVPIAVSRSHRSKGLDELLAGLGPIVEILSGSVGLKIGLIAEGRASAYVNASNRCNLWDSAGPSAILDEAGGTLSDVFGDPLSYADRVQHTRGLFAGTSAAHRQLREPLKRAAYALETRLRALPAYPPGAFRSTDPA